MKMTQSIAVTVKTGEADSGELKALIAQMRALLQDAVNHIRPEQRTEFEMKLKSLLAALDEIWAQYADELASSPTRKRWETERKLLGDLDRQVNIWGKLVRQASNGGWQEIKGEWHAMSGAVEQKERQRAFATTTDAAEFMQELWWMTEATACDRENLLLVREARRARRFDSDKITRQLVRTDEAITQRLYEPAVVCEREEAAYQQQRAAWDRKHRGQHIAVHWGEVIAAHADRAELIEMLRMQQAEHGPIRAYIVQIGAPVLNCTVSAGS
jgi:hypothetical protein